ncbi:MAG: hypothetical protein AAFU64_18255, partial [Bacteroidota bacterium]
MTEERLNAFFDSLEFQQEPEAYEVTASKFPMILEDLRSEDSLTREEASAFLYYDFIPITEDLPQLYEALTGHFPFDSIDYRDIKSDLLSLLEYEQDERTIPFLVEFYRNPENANYQSLIYKLLLTIQTEESFRHFFDLIEKATRELEDTYQLARLLTDSSDLFQQFLSRVLQLNDYAPLLFQNTLENALDRDLMHPEQVLEQQDKLLAISAEAFQEVLRMEALEEETEDYPPYYILHNFLRMYEAIPNHAASNDFIKKMMDSEMQYTWTKNSCLAVYLAKGFEPKESWIIELLNDKDVYYTALNSLKEAERLDLVPAQFLAPEKIAQGMMEDLLYAYDYSEFELST